MTNVLRRVKSYIMYVFWLFVSMCDNSTRLTNRDYKFMRKQLGITIPNRPAPSSDPNASNPANFDESKVNSYILPDPLIFKNGEKVTTEEHWQNRRLEITEDFEREVYGRVPENVPVVKWRIVSEEDIQVGIHPARQKTLEGWAENPDYPNLKLKIQLLLTIPLNNNKPVPVVLKLGSIRRSFEGQAGWKEKLLSKRWGYAILAPYSVQGDDGADLAEGIIGLVNAGKPRKPEDWGALRAWAWGASRAVDYFETDEKIDSKRIAIEGLSRFGKAALVAMAFDQRFSLAFAGSSGVGGAKIMRRKFAEQVENVTIPENYHWFCGNFIKYASILTPDNLPVDAHELIALCAPRPVFISSGSAQMGDQWADPKGMFLGGVHAAPVYELLGKKGLDNTEFPPLGTPLISGEIAFRQHEGGHTNEPNWTTWIQWASEYWEVDQ